MDCSRNGGGDKLLPKKLSVAVRNKLRYLEQYACVSDLVNQSPFLERLPSSESGILLNSDSDGDTSTEAKRFFSYMFQASIDNEHYVMKWKALREALCSPGKELLCYILNEEDDSKLKVLEEREKLVCETFRKEVLNELHALDFLNSFNFRTSHREKIQCKIDKDGNQAGNILILKFMVKYLDWFPELLRILKNQNCKKLAEDLRKNDPELTAATDSPAHNTRSSHRPPLPKVDDPDQVAQRINTLTSETNFGQTTDSSGGAESCSAVGSSYDSHTVSSGSKGSLTHLSSPKKLSHSKFIADFSHTDLSGSVSQSRETVLSPTNCSLQRSEEPNTSNSFDHGGYSFRSPPFLYPKLNEQPDEGDEESCHGLGFQAIYQQRQQEETRKKARSLQETLPPKNTYSENSKGEPSIEDEASNKGIFTYVWPSNANEQVEKQIHCEIPTCSANTQYKDLFTSEKDQDQHNCSESSVTASIPTPESQNKFSYQPFQVKPRKQSKGKEACSIPAKVTTYRCANCQIVFLSEQRLAEHKCSRAQVFQVKPQKQSNGKETCSIPAKVTTYRCANCLIVFLSEQRLAEHKCSRAAPVRASMNTGNNHKNVPPCASQNKSEKRPERQERCSSPGVPAVYRCRNCSIPFWSETIRDHHKCSQKASEKTRASKIPNDESVPSSASQKKSENHPRRQDRPSVSVPTIYRCKCCSDVFPSPKHLDQHSCLKGQTKRQERCNIPSPLTIYHCKVCLRPFYKERDLQNHRCIKDFPK
ncbi:hypothetical protein ElyMa_004037200 [Elysia marginata]|uniref:Caspase recruitment domain-containing protein n=1 Tax=Elysia marginata TaxID=1093978 RepID=A0AAV4G3D9_9GAST|nr:hypothetical protein ElyMa_004037200 [Elysia marginata]